MSKRALELRRRL